MKPTPWPAYITMLSKSPVVVLFGTVPAKPRISLSTPLIVEWPMTGLLASLSCGGRDLHSL
uniref:Uncharacterized protein n=1 Tax=Glycine max TaxID=3847 RepID=C6T612_SOYBN|nr:unknown [Glycine max]